MTETLFAFDERNYHQCQQAYRGEREQEYYLGDYRIEAGANIAVRADRKAVGACSVIKLSSRNRLFFKRTWQHIREDATDVVVLWFVRRGGLRIDYSGASIAAVAGDFAITRSTTPFAIECETDADGVHEVLHAIVPSHLFRQFLHRELKAGVAVRAGEHALALAETVLAGLFANGDLLSEESQQRLLDGALAVVAEVVGAREDCLQVRPSLREERLREVLRYIDVHLCDPNLSAAMVARGCGISPRYLSALLREHGTSFSERVWGDRVRAAGRWLAASTPADISIAEVAFRVGFKSAAHFSRMFKRTYGRGPREYRNECQQQRQNGRATRAAVAPLYLASSDGEVSKQSHSEQYEVSADEE